MAFPDYYLEGSLTVFQRHVSFFTFKRDGHTRLHEDIHLVTRDLDTERDRTYIADDQLRLRLFLFARWFGC